MTCNAIILAAGKGSRLGTLTQSSPKCMLFLSDGVSIIDFQIKALLHDTRIDKIYIVVGYLQDLLVSYIRGRYPSGRIHFVTNDKFNTHNTAHSLSMALEASGNDRGVIQMNGDVLFDGEVIKKLLNNAGEMSLVCINEERCSDEEMKVITDSDGVVKTISKLNSPKNAIGEAFGVNYFSQKSISPLQDSLISMYAIEPKSYFEDGINLLIASESQCSFKVLPVGHYPAIEVDFPEDYERAKHLVQSGQISFYE